jgi:hypothetical protein
VSIKDPGREPVTHQQPDPTPQTFMVRALGTAETARLARSPGLAVAQAAVDDRDAVAIVAQTLHEAAGPAATTPSPGTAT